MSFAPGLVGTFQDSDGGGGRHRLPPPISGNSSWRGSSIIDRLRRRLGCASERRFARPAATSCFVSQPLAFGADESGVGTCQIVEAKPFAVVVSEIELGSIAMQVRLADVEIAAVNAALEDREEVFDRIGVPESGAHVFLGAVVHGAVAGEIASKRSVDRCIVRHQVGRLIDMRDDDRLQALRGHIRHAEAAHPAIALDERQDRSLGWDFTFAIARLAANEGFIRFDNLVLAAELIAANRAAVGIDLEDSHCLANAVPEEPRRLEAAAKRAVKLPSRNALFAGAHQVDCLNPDVHRHVARFKHGSHAHRERLTAGAAFPQTRPRRLAFQLRCFADCAAVRADRSIGPQPAFDVGDSGFFVAKFGAIKGGFHGGFPRSAAILPMDIGMSSVTLPINSSTKVTTPCSGIVVAPIILVVRI
jgi:hypothetical protein